MKESKNKHIDQFFKILLAALPVIIGIHFALCLVPKIERFNDNILLKYITYWVFWACLASYIIIMIILGIMCKQGCIC